MKVRIQVIIESETGKSEIVQEIAQLQRTESRLSEFGLTLAEAKEVTQKLQQTLVEQQSAEYLAQKACCWECGKKLLHKGEHTIIYRTLFGTLHLKSPRLYHCKCRPQASKTFSPLAERVKERTAPELLYVESKFASLMSYGLTTEVLQQFLPIGRAIYPTSVRNRLYQVAERMEQEMGEEKVFFIEGCQAQWGELPQPDLPLTVGLDGAFVHSTEQTSRSDGWFEVIAGKSVTAENTSKRFAFVTSYDEKPKRRLFEVLKSQGMQMNQQITFLSDGGDSVREVQLHLNPQAEHWLDWFHITMRLTVMKQMAKSIKWAEDECEESPIEETELSDLAIKEIKRIKWFLWHGNVVRALDSIEEVGDLAACAKVSEESSRLQKAIDEFHTYIENNVERIPNFGERRRNREKVSTAFVESTVNQVISKRMVKKQQMRWSRRGAHLLLQVRTRELNGDLRSTFDRWYSGCDQGAETLAKVA